MALGKEKVEMVAIDGKHLYKNEEKCYPSVTTVLDIISYNKYIVKWANKLGFSRIDYEFELNIRLKFHTEW